MTEAFNPYFEAMSVVKEYYDCLPAEAHEKFVEISRKAARQAMDEALKMLEGNDDPDVVELRNYYLEAQKELNRLDLLVTRAVGVA